MSQLVQSIAKKNRKYGIVINTPATQVGILSFEQKIGFLLPDAFKDFYLVCNGFGCTDDIFNMLSLSEIIAETGNYGTNWFYFAEYMIYSDVWGLKYTGSGAYEIFNSSEQHVIPVASLEEFLFSFLTGNVFEVGGLYSLQEAK